MSKSRGLALIALAELTLVGPVAAQNPGSVRQSSAYRISVDAFGGVGRFGEGGGPLGVKVAPFYGGRIAAHVSERVSLFGDFRRGHPIETVPNCPQNWSGPGPSPGCTESEERVAETVVGVGIELQRYRADVSYWLDLGAGAFFDQYGPASGGPVVGAGVDYVKLGRVRPSFRVTNLIAFGEGFMGGYLAASLSLRLVL